MWAITEIAHIDYRRSLLSSEHDVNKGLVNLVYKAFLAIKHVGKLAAFSCGKW